MASLAGSTLTSLAPSVAAAAVGRVSAPPPAAGRPIAARAGRRERVPLHPVVSGALYARLQAGAGPEHRGGAGGKLQ